MSWISPKNATHISATLIGVTPFLQTRKTLPLQSSDIKPGNRAKRIAAAAGIQDQKL